MFRGKGWSRAQTFSLASMRAARALFVVFFKLPSWRARENGIGFHLELWDRLSETHWLVFNGCSTNVFI